MKRTIPKRCDGGCGKAMPKRGKFCPSCKKIECMENLKKHREKKKNDE